MKHEQVVPNYKLMFESSITLLALVASGWLLIKLVSACFWLPSELKKYEMEQREAEKKFIEEEKEKLQKKNHEEEEENSVKENDNNDDDNTKKTK